MASQEELLNRLREGFDTLSGKIRESPSYQKLRERFESLSPNGQKAVLGSAAAFALLLLLLAPLNSFFNSLNNINQFESHRSRVHDLYKAASEGQSNSGLTQAPAAEVLRTQIESILKSNQILSEQILSISNDAPPSYLPKEGLSSTTQIRLSKLNLRQIIDAGLAIQGISTALKIIDLDVRANTQDSRYFDVNYRLIALQVPSPPTIEFEPEPPAKKSGKKPKGDLE